MVLPVNSEALHFQFSYPKVPEVFAVIVRVDELYVMFVGKIVQLARTSCDVNNV